MGKPKQVTCRKCGHGPYTPSFTFDFYEDGKAGPGTGLCETCMLQEALKSDEPVEVPDNHRNRVCLGKGGKTTCRFLVFDGKYKCAKGSQMHNFIESRVGTMGAKGDNCSGSPEFKAK